MSIHLAVVGSKPFTQLISTLSSEFEDVRIAAYPYHDPREVEEIAKALGSFDGVFFSGSFPYTYAIKHIERERAHHVVQDEHVILTTLLYITQTQSLSLKDISLDLIDPARIHSIISSFPHRVAGPLLKKIDPYTDYEEIIEFHKASQHESTKVALTSIEHVHHRLREDGYTSHLLIEPVQTVRHHLNDLIQRIRQKQSEQSQFAIVLYDSTSQEIRMHLQSVRYLGGQLQEQHTDFLTLLTTKGMVEQSIANGTILPNEDTSTVGIGYGADYQRSLEHALLAVNAKSDKTVRIVDDTKRLTFISSDESIRFRVTKESVYDMMKQTGISPTNIEKMIDFSNRQLEFTAKEMTDYLQVTRRTTERLIKKMVDAKLLDIIGEEMSYQQGRPRSVYKFNFPA